MNGLSLLFYFVGVVGNIGTFASVVSVLAMVALPIYAVFIAINSEDEDDFVINKHWSYWRKCLIGFTVFYMIASFIPSERTIYMIAASEMGEEVINTDEFNKLRIILNDKLDELIHEDDRAASDE